MTLIGVVSNPTSGRNRRAGFGVDPATAAAAGALHRAVARVAELPAVLAEFAHAGVEVVVVDGGDGTVRAVLAGLSTAFAAPPAIMALASGTTNLIAGDVGPRGPRAQAFARLVARSRGPGLADATVERAPLVIEQGDGTTEIGFFFGAGALAFGTHLTRRHIERGRFANTAGTVLGIAATTLCLLAGGRASRLARGVPMTVTHDALPAVAGPRFLMLATTLERLVLGLHPFWGRGPGAINVLDIAAPPPRFARALPALLRARPRPWMAEAYRSVRAQRVTVALEHEALLDGEWLRLAPGRPLSLRAGAPVRFVRP
jgi:hypothetical protein